MQLPSGREHLTSTSFMTLNNISALLSKAALSQVVLLDIIAGVYLTDCKAHLLIV